jgi:hypothetical protein
MTQFLKFTEVPAEGKTKIFSVYSTHDTSYLGYVYWNTGWRRYVMHFDSGCDWSIECMAECYKFVGKLMQDRNKPKPTRIEEGTLDIGLI